MKQSEHGGIGFLFKLVFYGLIMAALLWGGTFLKCEYETVRYLDDGLRAACIEQYGAPAQSKVKLLEYDEAGFAKLYLTDTASGSVAVMVKDGASGSWKLVFSKTEWTRADKLDVVWPYVHYNKES